MCLSPNTIPDHPSAPGISAGCSGKHPALHQDALSGEMTRRSKSWLSRNGFPRCHEQHKGLSETRTSWGHAGPPLGSELCVHHEVETDQPRSRIPKLWVEVP